MSTQSTWTYNNKYGTPGPGVAPSAVSEAWRCAITGQIMQDPVMDPEGHSYERRAIEDWLRRSGTSPISCSPLFPAQLIPNRALRDTIVAAVAQTAATPYNNSQMETPAMTSPLLRSAQSSENVVALDLSASAPNSSGEIEALVSVRPPSGHTRTPTNVCVVLDTSGSMGGEASIGGAGAAESHGLSLLDVVKHAVRTIIHSLEPEDNLALVGFSSDARVVFELTAMDAAGKVETERLLDTLAARGQTNIWGGLQMGLDVLRGGIGGGRSAQQSSLMLLTDGQPNIVPPRGHIPMLQRYKEEFGLCVPISTFGFGYNLDSSLLSALAVEGGGMYTFIPDASFVGTAFIHTISNTLATLHTNVILEIQCEGGTVCASNAKVGGRDCAAEELGTTTTTTTLNLGTLQYGQSRDILIKVKATPGQSPVLMCHLSEGQGRIIGQTSQSLSCCNQAREDFQYHRLRLLVVDCISTIMQAMADRNMNAAQAEIERAIRAASETGAVGQLSRALCEDLKGQISEACSKPEWFEKWGVHYLPSLQRAHLLQQCTNFKDPGVQAYGGQLFQSLRDTADEVFNRLPPPEPSRVPQHVRASANYTPSIQSMAAYNDPCGGCFHGDCLVTLIGGGKKRAADIVKGDIVRTANGQDAVIRCVMETHYYDQVASLVQLPGGLKITPYHPIRIGSAWKFPIEVAEPQMLSCEAVYTFVLEEGHSVVIEGIECVTLGHGLRDDVVRHDYFGSSVVADLAACPGFQQGRVAFWQGCFQRDPETGLVCGLNEEKLVTSVQPQMDEFLPFLPCKAYARLDRPMMAVLITD